MEPIEQPDPESSLPQPESEQPPETSDAAAPGAFHCHICEEASAEICGRCTRDVCDNHLCDRCGFCSDCCSCDGG